jgi:Tol biopolymer transport system component
MVRLVLLSLAVLGLAPAGARATLVFDREPLQPAVWVADDDGGHARRLASGSQPRIGPDGKQVVYAHTASTADRFRSDLMAVPADGGAAPRLLAKGWRDPSTFAWSPDARTIATVVGPELGAKDLVLIDVAGGGRRTVAHGFFNGVSFSPDDAFLAYARSPHSRYPPATDIYRTAVPGGSIVRITTDHASQDPLWGPADKVVFSRLVDAERRRYGPKSELYVMHPDGTGVRRLTKTKVDPLLFGLTPTQWSADGTRLLAQFTGQDTTFAETVDPVTGAHRALLRAQESGLAATGLSADGSTVLGATGGFDPGARHDVVAVPYDGGTPTLLARNAADPDWTR